MFRKQRTTQAVEQVVARGVNYELSLADRARRSERRAWLVAGVAVMMSLALLGGYFYILPLKEKVPYLVMADPYTGTATIARLVGDFQDPTITTQEAINKSNAAQFVMARESYDTGIIGQQNWRQTLAMAGARVAPGFRSLHADTNPRRPYNQYGNKFAVRIRILSISLIPGPSGKPPRGATVRFQRSLYNKLDGSAQVMDGKIATLEFLYDPTLKFDERDRLLNPLGFLVTDYRVDNDYGVVPAPEPAFPAPDILRTGAEAAAWPGSADGPPEIMSEDGPASGTGPSSGDDAAVARPHAEVEP